MYTILVGILLDIIKLKSQTYGNERVRKSENMVSFYNCLHNIYYTLLKMVR